MREKVGVIIPFFNAAKYVEQTLKSLQHQDVELCAYLINDGSAKSQRERLSKIVANYKFVKIIDKENGGLSSARNRGIEEVEEDYILFLDSDDLLGFGQLRSQMNKIVESEADYCITKYTTADARIGIVKNQPSYFGEGLSASYIGRYWERGISIPVHSVLFRKCSLGDVRFNEKLKSKEDFDFWLRYLRRSPKESFVDDYMCIYRVTTDSMSRNPILSSENMYKVAQNTLKQNIEDGSSLMANIRRNYGLWKAL